MIIDKKIAAEETHRRSPATRSYNQKQAKELFEKAGFNKIQLYSEFTTDPVKPEDTVFVVSGQKISEI